MVLLLVFMQLTRDLFAIAKFLSMTWHLVVRDMTIAYHTVNIKLTYFAYFHHLRCNTISI